MPDDSRDARPQPDGEPEGEGLADGPRDAADGTVKPQGGPMDRPGTEAADDAGEPMSNEPLPVTEDEPGVGLTPSDEESVDGMRGM